VLVASPFVADVLAGAGVAAEQLRVVPYPVGPGGGRPGKPGTDVVYIGRLVAAKGVDVLLRSLGRLDGVRAAIAGDGPERDRLERLAREQGLEERATFHGWVDDDERARLLASARTLVLPSLWDEPFGIVGLEALAAGVPVVASDVGGIPSWLADGEAGLLVPRGDSDALAEALGVVLRDDDAHRRLADAAPDVAARFSIERHLELLLPELSAAAS
jgi:glycosyltransferase involved in cell wall biosynthesis